MQLKMKASGPQYIPTYKTILNHTSEAFGWSSEGWLLSLKYRTCGTLDTNFHVTLPVLFVIVGPCEAMMPASS